MKSPRRLFLASCVLALACQPRTESTELPNDQAVIDTLAQLGSAFSRAYVEGDVATMVALYTEDAALFPNNSEYIRGRADIERYWTLPEGRRITHHRMVPVEVDVSETMASDFGHYEISGENDGEAWGPVNGKYLVVWKRNDNGQWRMHLDMWNSLPQQVATVRSSPRHLGINGKRRTTRREMLAPSTTLSQRTRRIHDDNRVRSRSAPLFAVHGADERIGDRRDRPDASAASIEGAHRGQARRGDFAYQRTMGTESTDYADSPAAAKPLNRLLPAVTVAGLALAGAIPATPAQAQTVDVASPQTALRFTRVLSGDVIRDTASSPSASWVDVDIDGDEDLYVLNGFGSLSEPPIPQPNVLYLNDGVGGFVPVPDHPLVEDLAFSGSATWGDFDNDGDPDLFVANQQGADNFLYRNDGAGTFIRLTDGAIVNDGGRSFSAAWIDVNGDGLLDLHVLNGRDGDGGEVDFLYRNLGNGEFERLVDLPFTREALRSGGAAWADFDGDGDADLFLPVYSTGQPGRLYRNDGDWRFTELASEVGLGASPLPYAPAAGVAHWVDYDNDGDLDLFVGTTGGTIDFLFANDGDGHFERVEAGRIGLDATYVSDALWADLDNDGNLDLVLAVWGGASEIYLNDGRGQLRPVEAGDFGAAVTFASSASAADIDGDGDLDVYLTQWPINETGGAPNHLYRNERANGNWLKIDLEATESNRSAIGALVTVTAEIAGERRQQLRLLTSRTSWRSANSLTQHFGLGDAERVERIEVTWPSGRHDSIAGPIEVNERLAIIEGRGLASRTSAARPGESPARAGTAAGPGPQAELHDLEFES